MAGEVAGVAPSGHSALRRPSPFRSRRSLRANRFLASHSQEALVLRDRASGAVSSTPTTSLVRHFPASVLSLEQRDECKASSLVKEKPSQSGSPFCEEKENNEFEQYFNYFGHGLLYQPCFSNSFPLSYPLENPLMAMSVNSIVSNGNGISSSEPTIVEQNNPDIMRPEDVLALAKRAMTALRKAASLVEKSKTLEAEFSDMHFSGLGSKSSTREDVIEEATVRSNKRRERQLKKRKVSMNLRNDVYKVCSSVNKDINKKLHKSRMQDDPLRFFLWGPETKQLLTVKEEKDLFAKIQDLMRLNEVKQRLVVEFNREPTLAEWAQAAGMSSQDLQSSLHSGRRSRDKLIYANFLLVVHIAKQYEGKGLNIQDLLQVGSMGLMKSLERFKPKSGCRFPSYAYWWIRQSIRKTIHLNSRTIRLPENVYALLKTIKNARRLCMLEGRLPTSPELARRVGVTVERLESVLSISRNPISLQERAWADQDVTFQEITADPEIETPELSFCKQVMRQHVHGLLGILAPRERRIMQYRYGFYDNQPMSLSEIGNVYGVSKERVRQLESRAMEKLKDCLSSHGLGAYTELLI